MAILNHISTLLKPGRLTLVLGPPGGGKSSLLKAMAGKLSHHGLQVKTLSFHRGSDWQMFYFYNVTCMHAQTLRCLEWPALLLFLGAAHTFWRAKEVA